MSKKTENQMPFAKENYIILAISAAFFIIGYLLMVGGKSTDPNVFNYDELFSFRRITLAPIVILIGVGLGFYAILKKPKEDTVEIEEKSTK